MDQKRSYVWQCLISALKCQLLFWPVEKEEVVAENTLPSQCLAYSRSPL